MNGPSTIACVFPRNCQWGLPVHMSHQLHCYSVRTERGTTDLLARLRLALK